MAKTLILTPMRCALVLFPVLLTSYSCQDKKTKFFYLDKHLKETRDYIYEVVLVKNPINNADSLKTQLLRYQRSHGKRSIDSLIKEKNKNYRMYFFYKTSNTSPFIRSIKDPNSLSNIYI